MYTIEDLLASAVAQKPGDFEETFNQLMLDKVSAAIDDRKYEIGRTMFNPIEEDEKEE